MSDPLARALPGLPLICFVDLDDALERTGRNITQSLEYLDPPSPYGVLVETEPLGELANRGRLPVAEYVPDHFEEEIGTMHPPQRRAAPSGIGLLAAAAAISLHAGPSAPPLMALVMSAGGAFALLLPPCFNFGQGFGLATHNLRLAKISLELPGCKCLETFEKLNVVVLAKVVLRRQRRKDIGHFSKNRRRPTRFSDTAKPLSLRREYYCQEEGGAAAPSVSCS